MSRIGNKPIVIPKEVTVEVIGNLVKVSGPKGKLEREIDRNIFLKQENGELILSRKSEDKNIKAKHGLYRALINNMVVGVTSGFEKKLIVNGVGFKLNKQGNKLVLNLGFSHPINFEEPAGVEIAAPNNQEIIVKGIDKELVGLVAAKLRELKPVEPYHLYGIRYSDETVVKKQGKTAAKK